MQRVQTSATVMGTVFLLSAFCNSGSAQDAVHTNVLDSVLTRAGTNEVLPLHSALGQLGGSLPALNGYVLFGLELRGDQEPVVKADWKDGVTLGDGLHRLLNQLPDLEMRMVSGRLVEVYPHGALGDPADLLNLQTREFTVQEVSAERIIIDPAQFVPVLHTALSPKSLPDKIPITIFGGGGFVAGQRITLHLHSATVRQVLNAVSEATEGTAPGDRPIGWWYRYQPGAPEGQRHQWGSLYSLPYDWGFQRSQQ